VTVAYLDCSNGAAGDMLLGAFVDAGLPLATLEAMIDALGLANEARLEARPVTRGGFRATHLVVHLRDGAPRRTVPDLLAVIDRAALSDRVRAASRADLERLAAVEARLHGVAPDQLHLHELAGTDTIVDVVGFHTALEALGIAQVTVSPITVGSGTMRIAHGTLGVPGPATAELLKGAPIQGSDVPGEATTPHRRAPAYRPGLRLRPASGDARARDRLRRGHPGHAITKCCALLPWYPDRERPGRRTVG